MRAAVRVFFSHSSRDKALLRELRGYLPPWVTSWIDEDQLLFGVQLEPTLRKTIDEEVDYLVLFLGPEAFESDWVRREIEWALEREQRLGRVFLLPVLLVDVRERLSELGLAGRLTVNLADFSRGGIKMLAETLTNHFGGWLSENARRAQAIGLATREIDGNLSRLEEQVIRALSAVPAEWRVDVDSILLHPFLEQIVASQSGQLPLTPEQYYQRVQTEMTRATAGWEIEAISTLASVLWDDDQDQGRYADQNLAAVQKGARIRRLFIIPDGSESDFRRAIDEQVKCGIEVRIASNKLLADVPDVEDFVRFEAPEGSRAYVAHPTIDGSRRIRSGSLDCSQSGTARLRALFQQAWSLGRPFELPSAADAYPPASRLRPPGTRMEARALDAPVITCEEAAVARRIPLTNELKTLIVRTTYGLVAAHLPGDGVLSLRKVKLRLESPEAYLADPEDLLDIGLSAGTVSAVLDPVWSMPHLVSRRLLFLSEVMTNNGTRTGYFTFDPAILVEAADVLVGDFER
jgi:prolyl-tRNA editing enzyme YbaK/EbsC (Cys-tRNA(Pro) deacylase)